MISAKVVADTYFAGSRLTTLELVYPRFIHSELLTHRALSRNSASSRAIPIAAMVQAIRLEPAMPIHWGRNQPGMSADEELPPEVIALCKEEWLAAMEDAIRHTEALAKLGLHKQATNRPIEPFMHMQTLASATQWPNLLHLRDKDSGAQPEFKALTEAILAAMNASTPHHVSNEGYWHLPYVHPEEVTKLGLAKAKKVSVARCTRVSYARHGQVKDLLDDIKRHDEGTEKGHWSPFEHIAETMVGEFANFVNFRQYRYGFLGENIEEYERLLDPFADGDAPDQHDQENDDYV